MPDIHENLVKKLVPKLLAMFLPSPVFANSCGPMRTQDERYGPRFDHGLQTLSRSINSKNDKTEMTEQGQGRGREHRPKRGSGRAGRRKGDDDSHRIT